MVLGIIRACSFAALVVTSWGSNGLNAAPVTFAFSGTVSDDPLLDPQDPFAGSIASGTAFSGSYTFDSASPNSSGQSESGSYVSSGDPFALQITIAGFTFSFADTLRIQTQDSPSFDFYGVLAESGEGSMGISLSDSQGSALGGIALPLTAPLLSAFDARALVLNFPDYSGSQVQINGSIDSLTCISGCGTPPPPPTVPEPGILGLLLGSALGWRVVRRRDHRAAPR